MVAAQQQINGVRPGRGGRDEDPHDRPGGAAAGPVTQIVRPGPGSLVFGGQRGTTLQMLPDLLSGHQGARLTARAGGTTIEGPQALLVSNGPYEMGDVAGLGRRARLDAGTLGVVAVRVDSARQAAGLLRRGHGPGLTTLTAGEVTVDADGPEIPVGIDGETVMLPTPVRCAIRPRALRVVVPRLCRG